jgi:ABC-type molybdenum transport system ATPase subunit/photorepair protein PhrA
LLLDDPFAELDRDRASRVLLLLEEATAQWFGQTVLCVPREEEIPPAFTRLERWNVCAGRLERSGVAGPIVVNTGATP